MYRYYTRKLYNIIRQDYRLHLRQISGCATVIQRHWRGYAARKQIGILRIRTQLAITLQACVRGYFGRRSYLRKRNKILLQHARIAKVEMDFVALRTQMSNLNKYVLALAALVKQSTHYPTSPT